MRHGWFPLAIVLIGIWALHLLVTGRPNGEPWLLCFLAGVGILASKILGPIAGALGEKLGQAIAGRNTLDPCEPKVMKAFFATVSARLEPNGPGSRFPVVMHDLRGPGVDLRNAKQAARELREIAAGLALLAQDQAVWSSPRQRDNWKLPVNRSAKNLREYFVARDGLPLAERLEIDLHSNAETERYVGWNAPIALANLRERLEERLGLIPFGLSVVIFVVAQLFALAVVLKALDPPVTDMRWHDLFAISVPLGTVFWLVFILVAWLRSWLRSRRDKA